MHSFDRILLSAFEFDVHAVIKESRYCYEAGVCFGLMAQLLSLTTTQSWSSHQIYLSTCIAGGISLASALFGWQRWR